METDGQETHPGNGGYLQGTVKAAFFRLGSFPNTRGPLALACCVGAGTTSQS